MSIMEREIGMETVTLGIVRMKKYGLRKKLAAPTSLGVLSTTKIPTLNGPLPRRLSKQKK